MLVSGRTSAQQTVLESRSALEDKLEEYFTAIAGESLDVQMAEADFMIQAASDSLVRQAVALKIYDHYISSPVMGAEAVAIHVFDTWFITGKVKMESDMDLLGARIFADFNRQSLVGEKAPEIELESYDGRHVGLFGGSDAAGKYRILFFYDSGCAKCRFETGRLKKLLETEDFPVELYAIYAGDDRTAWDKYVSENFKADTGEESVIHLWDPELVSDFQRKFGVIQTPRLFLIRPDGIIAGRNLDVKALSQMLHSVFDEVELEYGSDESMSFYEGMFAGSSPSSKEVNDLSDYIMASTLEKGDTLMFRQMAGDFLYFLVLQRDESFKEGLDHLIDKCILSRGDVWKTADDSLKVIGLAEIYDDLLSRSEPGKRIPDIVLPGELLTSRKSESGRFNLRKLRGSRNVIIFYTDGCNICAAEKDAARKALADNRRMKVILVNVDEIISSFPSKAALIFDTFDLSSLPFIIETDRKGIITRRYTSLQ